MKSANIFIETTALRRCALPHWAWLCAAMTVSVLIACGRSGPPVPLDRVLPVPSGLVAWQRDGRALVTWRLPATEKRKVEQESGESEQAGDNKESGDKSGDLGKAGKKPQAGQKSGASGKGEEVGEIEEEEPPYGELEGYSVWIEQLPLNCPSCPPDDSRELALPLHSTSSEHSSVVVGGLVHYSFPLPTRPATWRIQVAAQYEAGQGKYSGPVYFDSPVALPAHKLNWTPAKGEAALGKRLIRLYWQPRRERIVRTLTRDGFMVSRDVNFRVNLFRRIGDVPWPLRPLNIQPLETSQLALSISADKAVEFQMRLVDRFGNEGKASPTVVIQPEVVQQ